MSTLVAIKLVKKKFEFIKLLKDRFKKKTYFSQISKSLISLERKKAERRVRTLLEILNVELWSFNHTHLAFSSEIRNILKVSFGNGSTET